MLRGLWSVTASLWEKPFAQASTYLSSALSGGGFRGAGPDRGDPWFPACFSDAGFITDAGHQAWGSCVQLNFGMEQSDIRYNLLWLLVRPALLAPPLLPIPLGRHSPSQPLLPVTALTWVPWTDTLLTPWGPRISSTVAWDPRALHTGAGGTALIDKPLRCSSPLLARLDLCVIVQ